MSHIQLRLKIGSFAFLSGSSSTKNLRKRSPEQTSTRSVVLSFET